MIMGHYATALFPYGKGTKAPLWLLLVCAALPDLLWLLLAVAGVEVTEPRSFLDVNIKQFHVDMFYSHSLVWNVALAAGVALLAYALLRDRGAALWCGVLVVGHLLADYLSGFGHEIVGRGSPKFGLDLYTRAPYLAFVVEAVFAGLCVAWYSRSEGQKGRPLTTRKRVILYAAFVGGSLAFLPNATHSMRQLLGLS